MKKQSLSDQIVRALENYNEEVGEILNEELQNISKEGVQLLKERSPRRTGRYAKGWRASKRQNEIILHNRDYPSLVHLLEKGHRKVGGGRVKPRVHVKPVEEIVTDEVVKRIENRLK